MTPADLPPWMRTAVGRWFAGRFAVVGRAWQRNIQEALVNEASRELAFARLETGVAANRFFGVLARPALRAEWEAALARALVTERNALIRWVALTSGEEAALVLGKQMERLDRGEAP